MEVLPFFLEEDDDILLFYLYSQPKIKKRKYHNPVKSSEPFNFETLTEDYCWIHFRFYKADILRLCKSLEIPEWIRCRKNVLVGGIEGLCILLKRLAYPNRYHDLMKFFPRTRCELSRIFSRMICIIIRKHGHLLSNIHQTWLTLDQVSDLAEAIVNKGSPYKECFGFLDGTVRPVCRPKQNQKEYYNGHKRVHAIKFQSMLLPNGLVAHLSGPVVGRRHDGYLLQSSQLIDQIAQNFFTPDGKPYHLYGDAAYAIQPHLITPFKAHTLTPTKRACNKAMSSIRESVEWGFCKVLQIFSFLDYKKNLKIGLQPVDEYYRVGIILGNCHTCIYGSQTSDYFNCSPPTLEEYLA